MTTQLVYVWNKENCGDKLRSLRAKANLTGKDMARLTGLSQQTIYAYETGDKTPTVENMAILATLFQVSLEDLFFDLRRVSLDEESDD